MKSTISIIRSEKDYTPSFWTDLRKEERRPRGRKFSDFGKTKKIKGSYFSFGGFGNLFLQPWPISKFPLQILSEYFEWWSHVFIGWVLLRIKSEREISFAVVGHFRLFWIYSISRKGCSIFLTKLARPVVWHDRLRSDRAVKSHAGSWRILTHLWDLTHWWHALKCENTHHSYLASEKIFWPIDTWLYGT